MKNSIFLALFFICYFSISCFSQTYFGTQNLILASPVYTEPIHIHSADLDGDGDMDVLVAHQNEGKIIWYANDGIGNFGISTIVSNQVNYVRYTDAADLDGDGDIDVMSASAGNDEIAWFANDGTGVFGPKQIISIGSAYEAQCVRAIDMNQDGSMDILSVARFGNRISWYENLGAGVFSSQKSVSQNIIQPQFAEIADLDGDGDMDALSATPAGDKIFWYENDGLNNFGIQQIISQNADGAFTVRASDIDGDGDMDVISASKDDDKIAWYENDGLGNFSTEQIISSTADGVRFIYIADMDGDGDPDILAAMLTGDFVAWYENDGSANFGPEEIIATNTNGAVSVTAADIDGDGDLDALSVSFLDDKIAWYENLRQTPLMVDATATGNNDGSNWVDAYTHLEDALAQGGSRTIHVAEGTYLPTTGTQRGVSFDIPQWTTILGGYASGGATRDPSIYETILSGNVDNNSSAAGNSYHVVSIKDVSDIVLDGVIIRDGNAGDISSFGRSRGGGLYIKNSSVTLNDVEVKWNRAIYGGGIFATLSPEVIISNSSFKKNRAEFGSALYHSNETSMFIEQSEIVQNTATNRCAIEVNNSLYTKIENSLIANNASTNANAIAFIATNRDQICEMTNVTILGESKDRYLITAQVGNGDQMDLTINNSIVAHQNSTFSKNIIGYVFGTFNFNHNNSYYQGSSVIGNGTSTLFSNIDGNLILNSDYSLDECSPGIDAGDDALVRGIMDLNGNARMYNTVDVGAFETQTACMVVRAFQEENKSFSVYPNPSEFNIYINTNIENPRITISNLLGETLFVTTEKEINISHLPKGIYLINLFEGEENIGVEKVVKN